MCHPDFGQHKLGYARARKIIRKSGIRWKKTEDIRYRKKQSDESNDIVFRKCKTFLDVLNFDPDNTFFIDEKLLQKKKDFAYCWTPIGKPAII